MLQRSVVAIAAGTTEQNAQKNYTKKFAQLVPITDPEQAGDFPEKSDPHAVYGTSLTCFSTDPCIKYGQGLPLVGILQAEKVPGSCVVLPCFLILCALAVFIEVCCLQSVPE